MPSAGSAAAGASGAQVLALIKDIIRASAILARRIGKYARRRSDVLRGLAPADIHETGELHLVVINMVTNAAQAIGGGVGKIAVSLWPSCETRPSPHMGGAVVCLSVADTGCGMDEVTLDRIFEPFVRACGQLRNKLAILHSDCG